MPATTPTVVPKEVHPAATLHMQLVEMGRDMVRALPNIAIALGVLLLTWFLARFAMAIADRLVGRTHLRATLKELMNTVVKLAIWILGILVALTIVMPGLTPASLIGGLGIGAVAIGFAFQDIFENFLAGVLIMVREKMRIGDVIECQGIIGKVEHIALRETHIRALSNELTIVPNSILFKNPVKIVTEDADRRQQLTVGVGYDADLDEAADAIRAAVQNLDDVDKGREVEVYATQFGASSIDFLVRWWTGSTPKEGLASADLAVRAIKRALDQAGIEIPYPYVTNTFKEPLPLVRVKPGDGQLSAHGAPVMAPAVAPVAQQDRASDS
jgi:small conductance mechanosensitive channel